MTSLKKHVLLACGVLIAFCQGTLAQQERLPADTLILHLGGNVQIWLVGPSLKQIGAYSKADSLKQLFLDDYKTAYAALPASEQPLVLHYLVHASGKRRIKAGTDVYTEAPCDLAREQQRMNLNLPTHQYTLYDLTAAIQIHVFFENPEQLSVLDEVSLTEATRTLADSDLKLMRITRLILEWQNNRWRPRPVSYPRKIQFEVRPNLGISLIGSQWGVLSGGDLSLILTDKYKVPRYNLTAGVTGYIFTHFSDGRFTYISHPGSVDLRLGFNAGYAKTRVHWVGFQIGYFYGIEDTSELRNKVKFGIFSEGLTPFQYAFDVIVLGEGRVIHATTIKFPF